MKWRESSEKILKYPQNLCSHCGRDPCEPKPPNACDNTSCDAPPCKKFKFKCGCGEKKVENKPCCKPKKKEDPCGKEQMSGTDKEQLANTDQEPLPNNDKEQLSGCDKPLCGGSKSDDSTGRLCGKDDPCAKKKDDAPNFCRDTQVDDGPNNPCPGKNNPCVKKDDSKNKKPEDPCKKDDNPCSDKKKSCIEKELCCADAGGKGGGKNDDSCGKKEDPCGKKEDPCAKNEDPCKKEEPKKQEPCGKKEDPCAKKEDSCAKKENPCNKGKDPCEEEKVEEKPCEIEVVEKDPCADNKEPPVEPAMDDKPCDTEPKVEKKKSVVSFQGLKPKKKEEPCEPGKLDPCRSKDPDVSFEGRFPCFGREKKVEPLDICQSKGSGICQKSTSCSKGGVKPDPEKCKTCKMCEMPPAECVVNDPCNDEPTPSYPTSKPLPFIDYDSTPHSKITFKCAEMNTLTGKPLQKKCIVPNHNYNYEQMSIPRPVSPHLKIFKFALPGYTSGSHRVTGLILSLYAFTLGAGALVTPYEFSWYVQLVESFDLPNVMLQTMKSLMAFPFVYHWTNGIRHLIYDTGRLFSLKATYMSGYFVILAAIAASCYLGFML